jgi:tetratricopeptide (TPR) repeat protein
MTYRIARLDDVEVVDDGRCPCRPVRHHLGITAFGVNAWTGVSAGDRIVNEHDEEGEDEELYVVLDGHARFEIEGEHVSAPSGSLVFVPPGTKRTAFAEEAGTTILAIGATPGTAYEASGWELWMPLNALYASGDYAGAADRGRELIEANPQYATPLYNLACCESLAGRTDDAIEHLRRAIEVSERTREFARDDSDLDPIRDDPRFRELVGEA